MVISVICTHTCKPFSKRTGCLLRCETKPKELPDSYNKSGIRVEKCFVKLLIIKKAAKELENGTCTRMRTRRATLFRPRAVRAS